MRVSLSTASQRCQQTIAMVMKRFPLKSGFSFELKCLYVQNRIVQRSDNGEAATEEDNKDTNHNDTETSDSKHDEEWNEGVGR